MRFVFPYSAAVSSNRRLIPQKGGRRWVLDRRYKAAMKELHFRALSQRREQGASLLDGPVKVELSAFLPDRRRRDVQNLPKLILDAMEGVAFEDDCEVVELVVRKAGVDRESPRVVVTVEKAHSEAA